MGVPPVWSLVFRDYRLILSDLRDKYKCCSDPVEIAPWRPQEIANPIWQKDYEAFMKTLGFETKLYKSRHPFTKGKVERLVRFVKDNFLAGRVFYHVTDLNWQALE